MKVTFSLPFLFSLMLIGNSPARSMDNIDQIVNIEDVFSLAFNGGSGIKVHPKNMGGAQGYKIEEFPEGQKNRNHWDTRGGTQVQFLVMHYTAGNFSSTLNHFTANVNEGRASAHFVITEEDGKLNIKGGIPIQVVPEDQRAWHAGISSWRGTKNLNASSIGIENINQGFTGNEATGLNLKWFPFDPAQVKSLGLLSAKEPWFIECRYC
jgi:N-acetylmuramoyl-L-alanine amidase